MQKILLLLDGSICSGKSTLKKLIKNKDPCIGAPHFFMCHLLCYAILRLIYFLRFGRERILGNYLLSFHIRDSELFRKILPLLMVLDLISIPLTVILKTMYVLISCKFGSKKMTIMIGDELILTPIAEYISFCHRYHIKVACNWLYHVLWASLIRLMKLFSITIILFVKTPVSSSVKYWTIREGVPADIKHFESKVVVIQSLLKGLISEVSLATPSSNRLHIVVVECLQPADCEKKALIKLRKIVKQL